MSEPNERRRPHEEDDARRAGGSDTKSTAPGAGEHAQAGDAATRRPYPGCGDSGQPDMLARVAAAQARGWDGCFPLPPRAKTPVPKGVTGYRGVDASPAQWALWAKHGGPFGLINDGNLGLRMPSGFIGLDVDCYDGKGGAATLAALELETLGVDVHLPPAPYITSRCDGSGIRIYRVPVGMLFVGELKGGGVEIIQHHHRYCVAPGSTHDGPEGWLYAAYDSGGEPYGPGELFDLDGCPELPWEIIRLLEAPLKGSGPTAQGVTPAVCAAFFAAHTGQANMDGLKGLATALDTAVGSRHGTLLAKACWAMREAAAGWYPAQARRGPASRLVGAGDGQPTPG